MTQKNWYVTALIVGFLCVGRTTAKAAIVEFFVNEEPGWVSAVTGAGLSIEQLDTTPANTALANEVASPPGNSTNLNTSILTFDAANTGLSVGFTFEVTESPSIIYRTTGNRINYEPSGSGAEDWKLQLTEGPKMRAFAIEIHEREGQGPEVWIFDGANVLDSTNTVPIFPNSFLGVLSDTPFDLVTYVHNDSTNEGFAHFQFAAIPEPSTLVLLGMGAVGLLVYSLRRWHRRFCGVSSAIPFD